LILLNFVALTGSKANGNINPKDSLKDGSIKPIDLYLDGNQNIVDSKVIAFEKALEDFTQQIARKKRKYKRESKFLEYVFYKTHHKFLKNYVLYSSLGDLIENSNYDCVAGTALYALILERLDIDYTIKEFDYHVLLIAKTDSKEFLFESTDPIDGFVKNKSEINKRIQFYTIPELENGAVQSIGAKEKLNQQSYSVNNDINIQQLAGLQFYNMAVKSYNETDYIQAIQNLEKGIRHYNANRFQVFLEILLDNLEDNSTINTEDINHYLYKYRRRTFAKK